MSRSPEEVRRIVLRAVDLACYREPVEADAITVGSPLQEAISELGFDSLASMEFCIAIELRTGLEFTPEILQQTESMEDVVTWILARDHSS